MNLLYTTEAVVEGGPRLPTRTVPWRMRARPARNDTRQDALAEGVRPLTPRSCSVSTPSNPSIETQSDPPTGCPSASPNARTATIKPYQPMVQDGNCIGATQR